MSHTSIRLKEVLRSLGSDISSYESQLLSQAIADVKLLEAGKKMLKCDMYEACLQPITHIDNKGFVYCHNHGVNRRDTHPCRKLRSWELRRLQRGEPITRY